MEKKVGDVFEAGGGGCNFFIKNKLKPGIFNDSNVYK